MRICFVVPRYGADIVGGAETLVRDLGERLAVAGHGVDVLTTCVRNNLTLANELPAGARRVNGVTVRRFPVDAPRDHATARRLDHALEAGARLTPDDEHAWVVNTGRSQPLLDAIDRIADEVDALLFAPYLHASTVFGAAVRPDRSLIIPCLHDEPQARFGLVQDTLRRAAGMVFNSRAEQELADRLVPSLPPGRVVGAGLEMPHRLDPGAFIRRHRLSGDLVTYAGRRESGKNFPLLLECAAAYEHCRRQPGGATLVVMGSGPHAPRRPRRGAVRDVGFLGHQEMLDGIAASIAAVNLSVNESLSYLVLESWSCGVPVIVHAACAVTRDLCEASGGGVWIRSVEEYAAALDRLRGDAGLRTALGEAGRQHVRDHYSWPTVMSRLESAVAAAVSTS